MTIVKSRLGQMTIVACPHHGGERLVCRPLLSFASGDPRYSIEYGSIPLRSGLSGVRPCGEPTRRERANLFDRVPVSRMIRTTREHA